MKSDIAASKTLDGRSSPFIVRSRTTCASSSVRRVVKAANLLVCDEIPCAAKTSFSYINHSRQSSLVMARKEILWPLALADAEAGMGATALASAGWFSRTMCLLPLLYTGRNR